MYKMHVITWPSNSIKGKSKDGRPSANNYDEDDDSVNVKQAASSCAYDVAPGVRQVVSVRDNMIKM